MAVLLLWQCMFILPTCILHYPIQHLLYYPLLLYTHTYIYTHAHTHAYIYIQF